MNRKIFACIFCIGLLALHGISAKDNVSLILQFGALGNEKVFTRSSTINNSTLVVPYTRMTFNPSVHAAVDIPLCDMSEHTFFALNFGYDFTWQGSYEPATTGSSTGTSSYTFTHTMSVLPEMVFAKKNWRIYMGTGFAFDIALYDYDETTSNYYTTRNYTLYQLLWETEIGARYCLTPHLALTSSVNSALSVLNMRRNGEYATKKNGVTVSGGEYSSYTNEGNQPLFLRLGLGVCYTF